MWLDAERASQLYHRLSSMQTKGQKPSIVNVGEILDVSLPEDAAERIRE